MRVIISDYSGNYESIHTVDTKSMFILKLKYQCKGYRVWCFPTLAMAKLVHKWFGKRIYKGTNISFEKFIPGTDQITHWSPYDNFR
jgi:hypothetical protein